MTHETNMYRSRYLWKVWRWPGQSVLGGANLMENTNPAALRAGFCNAERALSMDRARECYAAQAFLLSLLPGHEAFKTDVSLMSSKKSSKIHHSISHTWFSFYPRTLPIAVTITVDCLWALLLSSLGSALYCHLLLVFSLISVFPFVSSVLPSIGGSRF